MPKMFSDERSHQKMKRKWEDGGKGGGIEEGK